MVDQSGKGNFHSLQEAINSVRAFDPGYYTTIFVKEGTYYEKIIIPDYLCDLTIVGENKEKTIISNNDHSLINQMDTFRTYTIQVRGSGITSYIACNRLHIINQLNMSVFVIKYCN